MYTQKYLECVLSSVTFRKNEDSLMDVEVIRAQILTFFQNPLEVIACVLGIWSVYLIVKRSIWAFPIGIVMVLIYAVVFYKTKLYSDMLLQIFFVVMQVIGWYQWSSGSKDPDQKITVRVFGLRQILITAMLIFFVTLTLGYVMDTYSDTDVPWADAFTTAISVAAQFWLNARYLENWLLWIVVDILYIGLYCYKSLYLTAVLYALFLGLAMKGYVEWRKRLSLSAHKQ